MMANSRAYVALMACAHTVPVDDSGGGVYG
jgi:hypothetical protein